MKLHPRHEKVERARLSLAVSVVAIVQEEGLTHAELASVLIGELAKWNRYAIRDERKDEDQATGTANGDDGSHEPTPEAT